MEEPPDAPDARRPRDVLEHAVAASHAVDRVDENRPNGGKDNDETVCGDAKWAEEQDRERDERDGRNRAQELDHDGGGVEQRPRAADQETHA